MTDPLVFLSSTDGILVVGNDSMQADFSGWKVDIQPTQLTLEQYIRISFEHIYRKVWAILQKIVGTYCPLWALLEIVKMSTICSACKLLDIFHVCMMLSNVFLLQKW